MWRSYRYFGGTCRHLIVPGSCFATLRPYALGRGCSVVSDYASLACDPVKRLYGGFPYTKSLQCPSFFSLSRYEKIRPRQTTRTGLNERRKWCLLELNQGHMDFQSIALPPELRYPLSNLRIAALSALFLICECKGSTFYSNQQTFPQKNARVSKKRCNFASVFKWGTLLGDLSID